MSGGDLREVYITALGAYFPGEPVSGEEMETFLGRIRGRPSRLRARVLKANGIQRRHYALDRQGRPTHRNSELAARSVEAALARAGLGMSDLDFLAVATTQADLPVPGFGSMVHGELGGPPLEVASLHGVCASSVAALQAARLQVGCGEKQRAVACASELASRLFRASRYEAQSVLADAEVPRDTEFLRFMLSDGAGAAVLAPEPAASGISLRVDWIELRSHAGQKPPCMVAGANLGPRGELGRGWLDYPSFEAAASAGAINLKQDLGLLDDVVETAVDDVNGLIERGRLRPEAVDWVACHYSSELLRSRVIEALERREIPLAGKRWFSNLGTRGNVGSASLFVLLEELVREPALEPGQTILAVVPESGRFTNGFVHLTVVGAPDRDVCEARGGKECELLAELEAVRTGFERELERVPLLRRLEDGRFDVHDYRRLLCNLRQQVIEGSRWIARAASSLRAELHPIRSLFLRHAVDEHRDFELLERDFVAVGGSLEEIRSTPRNVGSEALASFLFERASRPDPFPLLGAMFIIEGLGQHRAAGWARAIQRALGADDDAVSFLLHHARADGGANGHLSRLDGVLASGLLSPRDAEEALRVARVTARLYRLQLEEIDRC